MPTSNNNRNLRGSRFPKPKGPASLILEPFRDWICMTLNCFWSPSIKAKILSSDGTQTLLKEADIQMSPLGWTAVIDLTDIVSSGSGGSGNMIWKGLWTAGTTAQVYEVWILQSGTATGTYISTANSNTNSPDTLTDWVQISTNRGQWQ